MSWLSSEMYCNRYECRNTRSFTKSTILRKTREPNVDRYCWENFNRLYILPVRLDDNFTWGCWRPYCLNSSKTFLLLFDVGCDFNMAVQFLIFHEVREHLITRFGEKWIVRSGPIGWPARSTPPYPTWLFVWDSNWIGGRARRSDACSCLLTCYST